MWEISPFMKTTQFKTPATKGWSEGIGRLKADELDNESGVGFVPPKGFVVVDADTELAVQGLETLFVSLNIKPFSYNTTRGKHFLFKVPIGKAFDGVASQGGGTILVDKETDRSDIDLKGGGRNGKNGYVIIKIKNKWRVNPADIMEQFENKDIPYVPYSLLIPRTFKMKAYEYESGPRDEIFFKWVTKLRSKGWTEDEVVKLALELKIIAHDDESLSETAEWARQKWESNINMGNVVDFTKESTFADIDFTKKNEDELEEGNGIDDADKLYYWMELEKNSKEYRIKGVRDYHKVATKIISETKLRYMDDNNQLWGINQTTKKFEVIKDLTLYIERYLINKYQNIKPTVSTDISKFLRGFIPVKKTSQNKYIISFNGKVMDVVEDKEVKLDGNEMMMNIIPHNLIDKELFETTHKENYKFINDMFDKWTKKDATFKKQMLQAIGTTMFKHMKREKAYFLLGSGSNGKSWFLELLIGLLGVENISLEDLKDLSANKFSGANLYGKIANINFDISADVIHDTALFKKITSGDMISAEYKGRDSFIFSPYATQWYGTNNIPYAREKGDSDAINRRIEIFPFNNVFDKSKIKEKDVIDLENMMISEKTFEVLARLSYDALNDALENGYVTSSVSKAAFDSFKKEQNHMYDFFEENDLVEGEPSITTYKRYKAWAGEYEYVTLFLNEFVKKYINVARAYGIQISKEIVGEKSSSRHRFIINDTEQ